MRRPFAGDTSNVINRWRWSNPSRAMSLVVWPVTRGPIEAPSITFLRWAKVWSDTAASRAVGACRESNIRGNYKVDAGTGVVLASPHGKDEQERSGQGPILGLPLLVHGLRAGVPRRRHLSRLAGRLPLP